MSMFKKEVKVSNGQPTKSKWQGVIDHMDAAAAHMSEAMNLLSMIGFDLQKGADFITRYRDSLIKTIEEAGGTIEPGSVEEQIKDYLPKALRRETQDADTDTPR